MNGRRPTMCVTVLQSQPSVSMPTLTMQRTSRPGGCSGLPELLRQLLEALGVDRPALAVARPGRLAHRVEREPHPGRLVALGLAGVGLVHDLRVDADRVHRGPSCSGSLRSSPAGCPAGGLVSRQPLVDHLGDRRVLADEDEHRRARVVLRSAPTRSRSSSHSPPSMAIGVFAHFRIASGFGLPRAPPRSAGVSCGRIQRQMLK